MVIDTLRATTTMTAILERGALAVRPVASLDEAYSRRAHDPELLLGGERNNAPPEGFDGGNSPYDWPTERVRGRRVIFSTTNGTRAIEAVAHINHVAMAALSNAGAAAQYLWQWECPALVVASGTQGQIALEDVLAAGAVVSHWPSEALQDGALIARSLFLQYQDRLEEGVRRAQHGQALARLGLDRDLAYAAQLDISPVVGVLCQDGWIRAES
ncbi:2-phosphosulfolactate phosphatase [Sulfobacillus sp. DSM 109850]|uniref:Probable 2-phosphosulfolactate phosphatase n=1 Tax=Sulfobacillus harzensis TaxID=2729629 RepID=A0A7Y0L7X7_9FIRM|nr:2-phosphosulfolactate phosphatase [Sulfobacillus harzensis]NMP24957.1 2-phosphosulfolactate phosphatase [Sulfobacillus harzensis]